MLKKRARDDKTVNPQDAEALLQELKENPFRKFNIAFSLMSIIPFLVFFYLLLTRFFSITILIGDIGAILFISILISLGGFLIGYGIIKSILNKLVKYAAEAKKSDQMKSIFVASVSHELRNPLTTVKTSLSNIMDGLLGQINEGQKKIIELCQDVIDRMHRLVQDLLDLHKIEAGAIEIRRKLCDITALLDRQMKEFQAVLIKKRINMVKDGFVQNLSLWGDEDKLMQIFNNLLSNAIKFTPDGGSIIVRANPVDEFIRLEVEDTGQGIPSDKLNKIFDKFERLDNSKEGAGLGLSITKDIVELHKGRIWAESEKGKGSKFIVVLPRDLRRNKR